jgi:multiple sugar transport system permease protein
LSDTLLGYLFIAPAAAVIVLVIAYPLANTFIMSTMHKPVGAPGNFIGLDNFVEALNDGLFRNSIYLSFVYATVAVFCKMALGIGIALVLNETFRLRTFVRASVIIPWTIPVYTTAMLFYWMYSYELGLFNRLLGYIGMGPVNWLGSDLALWSLILLNIWKGLPFFSIAFLAGLQAIPKLLYEAAQIDGASLYHRFRHVTIPGMKNVITIICMLSFLWSFAEFTPIYILTGGGPVHASDLIGIRIYTATFRFFELGYPAAMSVLLLPIFVPIIFVVARLFRR